MALVYSVVFFCLPNPAVFREAFILLNTQLLGITLDLIITVQWPDEIFDFRRIKTRFIYMR